VLYCPCCSGGSLFTVFRAYQLTHGSGRGLGLVAVALLLHLRLCIHILRRTSLCPTEFKCARMSSSIESDRGSLMNALNIVGREEEMCRDYTCCGLHLNDLHALVEHFEECHVVVWDPHSGNYNPSVLPSQQHSYVPPSSTCQGPFDPDDMELEFDQSSAPSSSGSSPPDTPVHTPLSTYPSVSAFDTTTVLPSRSGLSVNPFPSASHRNKRAVEQTEVFTAYARAKEYAVALATSEEQEGFVVGGRSGCVTPALLLSSGGNTPVHSPDGSRVNSPSPNSPTYASPSISSSSSTSIPAAPSPKSQNTFSRPTNSLLVTKPFKCPKPNCNKSYKQANGLKYHMTHGSCNFTPCKEGEVVKEGMSDSEVREVEKRLRPYACGVGDCARRYKNMNGLRYHYQHSGEHGAMGLTLLASGQHECLLGKRGGSVGVRQEQHQQHVTMMSQPQHPDLSQQNFYQPPQHQHPSSPQQPQQYAMSPWGIMNQQ